MTLAHKMLTTFLLSKKGYQMRSFQLEIPIRLIEPGLTVVDYPSYCR
ncbi:hypothetical protein D1AOALGA4SA_602 [Olavius algarvensis Delta 1 endosymbiont]|nr:hypothetical protein D1AOALGA4SA_602 [Olavius algarvensis Delta 1 endosymbiont]